MEKCYSTNGEDFNYTEIEDAIESAFDDPDLPIGTVVTIDEGDAIPWKAGDFADGFPVETLANSAYDEAGEYADGWPNCTKEQESDLAQRIKSAVNQWADDHGLQPRFYRVANIKEIKVKLTSKTGDYEILEI